MKNKITSSWWGAPNNFSDRKHERKISWLELLYDLVYVAAIGQFTGHLAEHLTGNSIAFFFLLFCLLFWSWVNGSQYYDLHGNDSIRTRVFTFLQMLGVAALAICTKDVFEGRHVFFAIALIFIQLLITYLWWSTGIWDPSHRKFNIFYTVNYLIALLLIIISLFTSYPAAMILWSIALLFNLTPGLTSAKTVITELRKKGEEFSASAALVERFGLFTIIVLAEVVLAIVTTISAEKDKFPLAWLAFFLGIMIVYLLWSIYFDMTSEQETKKGYKYLQWLIFLHFPLLASLGVAGSCMHVMLADVHATDLQNVEWTFSVSLAIIMVIVAQLSTLMENHDEDRSYIRPMYKMLYATSFLVLLLPLFSKQLGIISYLLSVTLLLFIPVFIGARGWVKFKFYSTKK
jgi:low temperature requirement protein LtrA